MRQLRQWSLLIIVSAMLPGAVLLAGEANPASKDEVQTASKPTASQADPVQEFVTLLTANASAPWETRVPGADRSHAFSSELPVLDTVRFQLKIDVKDVSSRPDWPIRCMLSIRNKKGWFYQSSVTPAVPFMKFAEVKFDLKADSPDWDAVGHYRPWDGQAARGIVWASLRLFSDREFEGAILIKDVEVIVREEDAVAGKVNEIAEIVDFHAPQHVSAGSLFETSFRLDREVDNPFDPQVIDIQGHFYLPATGERVVVPAFYDQDFAEVQEGTRHRLVPRGPGRWRIRYRPRETGVFKLNIVHANLNPPKTLITRSIAVSAAGAADRPQSEEEWNKQHARAVAAKKKELEEAKKKAAEKHASKKDHAKSTSY